MRSFSGFRIQHIRVKGFEGLFGGDTVGFQALIIANWMPWSLRLPHLLEILADEFVYAWALAMLLGVKQALRPEAGQPSPRPALISPKA